MMKKHTALFWALQFFSGSLFFPAALWAAPEAAQQGAPQPAKQALDQLRLLQQKLMSPTGNPAADGSSSAPQPLDVLPLPAANLPPINSGEKILPTLDMLHPKNTRNFTDTLGGNSGGNQNLPSEKEARAIDSLAFETVMQQLFPLSVEQTRRLHEKYQNSEFGMQTPVGTPPKPTATSQFVNLSTGSTPPVIRLAQGFVSSLVFLDSTGAPWPIAAYDLGDPGSFNINWDKSGNTLMIQSSKLYTYGNLAVRLKGLNTPVMLTLIPGQKAVDYRVDLRIQGYGPEAKSLPMEEGIPVIANDTLLHVLDGVPPDGSKKLSVIGGDASAWTVGDKMFIRTNLTILSPGWLGSMTSADGMHAYEMQKSPVLLVSWHGKVMQLKVEGL